MHWVVFCKEWRREMRFGDKAFQYDSRAIEQRRVAKWLAQWLELDASGLRGLEFGAGTGAFTEYLARLKFDSFIASDQSLRMLEVGREALPQVDWQRINAWSPDRGELVDRIYSCSLLQWAPAPECVFDKWKRILKPGGKMLLSIFVKDSLREFQELESSFAALQWRSGDYWIRILEKVGFEVERSEMMRNQLKFRNALDSLKSLHDIGAVQEHRMKVATLKRLLRRCDDKYLKLGYVPQTWNSVKIECRFPM